MFPTLLQPYPQCRLRNTIYQVSDPARCGLEYTNFNSDIVESPIILLVKWDLDYFMIVPDDHVAVRESWTRSDHCAELTPGGRPVRNVGSMTLVRPLSR